MSTYAGQHDDPSRAGGGLSIKDAGALLGIPGPTLRSWERRYGLPTTSRSVGGHRRYRSVDLIQLSLMRDEIAIGRHAGDAARWVRGVLDEDRLGMARVREVLDASRQLDPRGIRAVLERAHTDLGLAAALDEVVMPALRQVGSWWETGRCDVGQEHLTTEAVRAWLAKLITLATVPVPEASILLATGPGDLHTVGLEALAALLADQGIASRLLGPRTSERVLLSATLAAPGAVVAVVSHLPTQRRSAIESLAAVAESGVPTFYAGNAFLFPSSRRRVPGVYLGESLTTAAMTLSESLPCPV